LVDFWWKKNLFELNLHLEVKSIKPRAKGLLINYENN
jgi:hypothetical protein